MHQTPSERTGSLIWKHRRPAALSALAELWSAAAAIGLSALMADLLENRLDAFSAGSLTIVLLVSLLVFTRHLSARARLRLEHAVNRDLHSRSIDRLLDRKLDRITGGEGALVQEMLRDCGRAAAAAADLPRLAIGAPLTITALAWFLVSRGGGTLAAISLTLVPVAAALSFAIGRALSRRARQRSLSESRLSAGAVEIGRGIELLQASEGASKIYDVIAARAHELERHSEDIQELGTLATGVSEGLKTGVFLIAVWMLGREELAASESLGLLPAAYFLYSTITQALASGVNQFAGLSLLSELAEGAAITVSPELPGTGIEEAPPVTVSHLTYSYPGGRELIRDLSLEIQPGTWLAVTGPSGAGKTTFVRALLGFLTVPDGAIRLGGINLNHISPAERRRLFFLLTQEPLVLGFTLRENFQIANPEVSEADVRQALERMGLTARANEIGLDVPLTPAHFSGGEKERISLARLLVAKAPIAVLDEPGVFLDPPNEQNVVELLSEVARTRTLITVTHNPRILNRAAAVLEFSADGIRYYRNEQPSSKVRPLRPV